MPIGLALGRLRWIDRFFDSWPDKRRSVEPWGAKMASKDREREWKQWQLDPLVQYAEYDGGLVVRVPHYDWFKESGWCRLIGSSVDATVRALLGEMGWNVR